MCHSIQPLITLGYIYYYYRHLQMEELWHTIIMKGVRKKNKGSLIPAPVIYVVIGTYRGEAISCHRNGDQFREETSA